MRAPEPAARGRAAAFVAGIPLSAEIVQRLVDLVEEPVASTFRDAVDADRIAVALTVAEREQILRGFEDPPEGLAELRSVLLQPVAGGAHRSARYRHFSPRVASGSVLHGI